MILANPNKIQKGKKFLRNRIFISFNMQTKTILALGIFLILYHTLTGMNLAVNLHDKCKSFISLWIWVLSNDLFAKFMIHLQ